MNCFFEAHNFSILVTTYMRVSVRRWPVSRDAEPILGDGGKSRGLWHRAKRDAGKGYESIRWIKGRVNSK